MRYPMWRANVDGTQILVHNREEAYANPDQIKEFLPNKAIPEAVEEDEQEAEPEAPEAPQKRGPGRPKKGSA